MSGPTAPDMVWIPPGGFRMGATEDDRFASLLELPRHLVRIQRGFWIATHPITRAQAEASGVLTPATHRLGGVEPQADWPAMGLSRDDAERYAGWLAERTGRPFRLPTEAEWEHAARAGTQGPFHLGGDLSPAAANYLYDERARRVGPGHPTAVGAYPPNAWGLCDMLGSVAEWVADDWHRGYADAPADGSAWLDEPRTGVGVIRGGAWDLLPRLCRCAHREPLAVGARIDNVGFRLACDDIAPADHARPGAQVATVRGPDVRAASAL